VWDFTDLAAQGYEVGKGSVGATEKALGPVIGLSAMLVVVLIACLPHLAVVLTSLREHWFMTVLPESFTSGTMKKHWGTILRCRASKTAFCSALSAR
jgi:ABC-type spermidine/putrescine transport system permease subunit II